MDEEKARRVPSKVVDDHETSSVDINPKEEKVSRFLGMSSDEGYIDLEDIRDFLSPEDQEIFDNSDLPFVTIPNAPELDYAPNFDRIADLITQNEETARFITEQSLGIVHKLLDSERFSSQIVLIDKEDQGAGSNKITLAQLIQNVTAAVTDAHSNVALDPMAAFGDDEGEEVAHLWEGEEDAINFLIGNDFKVDRNAKTVMLPEGDEDDILSLEIDALRYLQLGGFRVFDWNGKDWPNRDGEEDPFDTEEAAVEFLKEKGWIIDEHRIRCPSDQEKPVELSEEEDAAIMYLEEVHDYETEFN